jgi:hypothetical protein
VIPTTHAEQVELAYASNVTLPEKFQLHVCLCGGYRKLLIVAALLHPIKSDIEAAVKAGKFGTQTAISVMRLGPIANRVPPVFTSPFPAVGRLLRVLLKVHNKKNIDTVEELVKEKYSVKSGYTKHLAIPIEQGVFVGYPKGADVTME